MHSYQDSFNLQQWQTVVHCKTKLRLAKEDDYRKGDKVLNNQAKYTQEKEIRVTKRNYSGKLRNKGTNSLPVILLQCGKVWKTSPVTRHHPPALWRINNWQTIWMSFIAGLKNTIHTSCNPPLRHTCTCTADKWRRHPQGLQKEQEKEGTRTRRHHTDRPHPGRWRVCLQTGG